ncbi:MAG: ATP-binding cassette domain-containing protein, partial [Chlamydiota bacterium]|nr:ATP-binding cassette domain-containing protein [Chlamydiota bacterium]
NGAGKTTLMKIIMDQEEPTTGNVSLPQSVGILKQNIHDFKDDTVLDVVIMGNERLWKAMQERDSLYELEMTDEVGMRLGDLEGIIAEENGYTADSDAEVLLHGMGILEEYYKQKMHQIPTDIQFRVLLCQAIFGEPQALLLDEPTNHLDMESIGWLEKFLHDYSGILVVTSHDRHFLNSVTTHIADIDYDTIILYPGNYDDMITAKTAVRQRAEQDAKSKEKKAQRLQEFVQRFSAGSRASQVQSRKREIERLKSDELKDSNIQRPYIRFPVPEKQPGKMIFKVENLCKSYEDLEVIKDFSIEIHRGDKIGVIGNNGRGKTTLLKLLAGALSPDKGQIEPGHQVSISYFAQNHSDVIKKKEGMTSFDWLKLCKPNSYDQDIRSVMGKMLFGGDDAFKSVKKLSGGETARLIIANMMQQEHNVIIMDEPNNHLDLEAVSALGWGIEDYKGTAIVASHDRSLLEVVATKLIAFEDDGIHVYEGTLDEYFEKKSS